MTALLLAEECNYKCSFASRVTILTASEELQQRGQDG
jgi:hypothetical protein